MVLTSGRVMLGPEIAFCRALLTEVPWGSMSASVHETAFTGRLQGHRVHLSSGHIPSPEAQTGQQK